MRSAGTGWWPSPAASTRPARARGPSSTPPSCTRSSPVTTRCDSTSLPTPVPDVVSAARHGDVAGLRIGIIKELHGEGSGWQPGVKARFDEAVEALVDAGAKVTEVSCPSFTAALAAYYLILPSEASSNLAKFDAMRYGLRVLPEGVADPTAEQVMAATRAAGFGDEVKRRIILGTYALSSGYYDAYYGSAQKVRTLIQRDFAAAFEEADVLVSPTAPTTAFPIGAKIDDPLAMYLNDVATIPGEPRRRPGHVAAQRPRRRGRAARRLPGARPRAGGRPAVPGGRRARGPARGALGRAAARPRSLTTPADDPSDGRAPSLTPEVSR